MALDDLVTGVGKLIKFLVWLILETGTSGTNDKESAPNRVGRKRESSGMFWFLIFIAIAVISTIIITIWLFIL